jgi:DNA repair protein RadC
MDSRAFAYPYANPAPLVRAYVRNPARVARVSELSRRIGPISDAQKAADVMAPLTDEQDQEVAWAMLLDTHGFLRRIDPFQRGTRDRVSVPIQDALRSAIAEGTRYVVLVHNHPSGSAEPSQADAAITFEVASACQCVDLLLLDHVVMGFGEFYSFREASRWTRHWKAP